MTICHHVVTINALQKYQGFGWRLGVRAQDLVLGTVEMGGAHETGVKRVISVIHAVLKAAVP
jgi:hypothetical protein